MIRPQLLRISRPWTRKGSDASGHGPRRRHRPTRPANAGLRRRGRGPRRRLRLRCHQRPRSLILLQRLPMRLLRPQLLRISRPWTRARLRRRCHRALLRRRNRLLRCSAGLPRRIQRPRRHRLFRPRRHRLLRPRPLILLQSLPTTWLRGWRRPLREWRRLPAGWKPPGGAKAVARRVMGALGTTKNARGLRCTAQGNCLRAQHKPRCVDTAAGTNQANIVGIMRAARVARRGLVTHAYTTTLGEAGRPVGCFGPCMRSRF